MKVLDEAGNASAISNVIVATMLASDTMHVSSVTFASKPTGGPNYQFSALVSVQDTQHYPVVGVTVTGKWGGLLRGTGSGVTVLDVSGSGTSAYATITHSKSISCFSESGGSVIFSVTSVVDPSGIMLWDAIQVTGSTKC